MNLIRVAFMYDFDETLSTKFMQEYSLFPVLFNIGQDKFWQECNELGKKHNMDSTLAYMYNIINFAQKNNIKITYQKMLEQGRAVEFFNGLDTYFDRINSFALNLGIQLDHYVISSGLKEMIEGSSLADKFTRVFASTFAYDDNGNAIWPAQAVNFTTKTQYIFRIRKDKIDNLYNNHEVNEYVPEKETLLSYSRMVYLGDGFTDIPCMKVIKDKGGVSICVYNPEREKSKLEAERIFNDKRVNYIAPADYSDNTRLTNILKDALTKIALDNKLSKY